VTRSQLCSATLNVNKHPTCVRGTGQIGDTNFNLKDSRGSCCDLGYSNSIPGGRALTQCASVVSLVSETGAYMIGLGIYANLLDGTKCCIKASFILR